GRVAGLVASAIDGDAQRFQAGQAPGPYHGAVLADPGGERDRVEPAEYRVVGADVLADAVAVHVEGEPRGRVAGRATVDDPAHVVVRAQAGEAGPVQVHVLDAGEVEAGAAEVEGDGRVEVAGAGTHDQALKRGQAHRRVHAAPTGHGGRAGTVAEVQHDQVQLGERPAQQRGGTGGHPADRDAVEPVPADAVPLRHLAVQRIGGGRLRQRGVVCGVEDGDLRYPRNGVPGRLDAGHPDRVVQRGELGQRADRGQHLVVDDDRRVEPGAAVHDPVPDRVDAAEPVEDLVHRRAVVGDRAG